MSDNETMKVRAKLEQARSVIASLLSDGLAAGSEGQRALDYFASDRFEPDFLPWPRTASEGTRPEDLNAANDD